VVVAVEIENPLTAKEAFGGDAVADSVGDADATHAVRDPWISLEAFSC
jgi:hypothetical protein